MYITPYSLSGFQDVFQLNDSEDQYIGDSRWKQDVGFDIKYNVTSDLTLDLTANTDFAQVEADEQQLNLTRFPLIFPKKGNFFNSAQVYSIFHLGELNFFTVEELD